MRAADFRNVLPLLAALAVSYFLPLSFAANRKRARRSEAESQQESTSGRETGLINKVHNIH